MVMRSALIPPPRAVMFSEHGATLGVGGRPEPPRPCDQPCLPCFPLSLTCQHE
jgi:hypothetical protein